MTGPEPPGISVIIAAYNRSATLPRAIASALRQSVRPAEIWIVDDASDDNPQAVVDACAASSSVPLHFIRSPANGGAGAARNLAMRATRQPLLAILDSDDEYLPGALEMLRAPFLRDPQIALSFADALVAGTQPPRRLMQPALPPEARLLPLHDGPPPTALLANPHDALLATSMIPTCATLFRADAARHVGFMPEWRFGEDWLFWLKLASEGAFVATLADAALVHRAGDNETGAAYNLRNATLQLRALLDVRDGRYFKPDAAQLARLEREVDRQMAGLRYHSSRQGLGAYRQALRSPEAARVASPLRHLTADPRSLLRALYWSIRPAQS